MLARKIAYIDLSRGRVTQEVIPPEWRQQYLGARGINMYLLYSLIDVPLDPLGPKNPLIFGAGLLTGLPGFGSGRCNVSAFSPACGNLGDSNMGGQFGAELRFAGFDHVVLTGESTTPVYILIRNDEIEIRDARNLWGKDTLETQLAIREENEDNRLKVAAIGVAGENRVRFASIITGIKDAAGRFGMGAVMGSKKVKALAVRGTRDISVAFPRELLSYYKAEIDKLMARKWTQAFKRYGTLNLAIRENEWGLALTRNEQGPSMGERGRALYPENIDRHALGHSSCFGCVVHCRHRYLIQEGPYAGTRSEGPDYGVLQSFGYMPDIPDFEFVLHANHVCNRLGLDGIDTGYMIAFAIDLYQRGIISQDRVGRVLEWGNQDSVLAMIKAIAHREGFGNILAEGSYALRSLPPEARPRLSLIRNALAEGTGERAYPVLALARAVASLAGHIHRNYPSVVLMALPAEAYRELYGSQVSADPTSPEGKAVIVRWHELLQAVCDSLGFCRFQSAMNSPRAPKFEEYSHLIRLATGWDLPVEQLMEIAERIYTTERLLLRKLGVGSRKDDAPPEKWFTEPFPHGSLKGAILDRQVFQKMLDEYYALHGWNEEGIPTAGSLQRLGIVKATIG